MCKPEKAIFAKGNLTSLAFYEEILNDNDNLYRREGKLAKRVITSK